MTKKYYLPNMVQAITVLTVLKMLTNAQTTCNQGIGRVVYERLPDHQIQGYDDEIVRDTAPPFRVLEKCQELCLRDRTPTNNLVRTCYSFDFQPGSRISSFSGIVEYEESTCYLTSEKAQPDGVGILSFVPNSVHYNEVCLSSSRIERECPSRHYVFERYPRKKLKLPVADIKEIVAANRTDCEDRCLNEFAFVCRSASYDITARTCWLSPYTRRSHPDLFEDDPSADYLENTCLNEDRRCDGSIIFVKEENIRLGGPFEVDIYANVSLMECQAQCLKADKYFCRAVEYDEQTKRCVIFEEDSISQKDDVKSNSPTHDLYDLVCLNNVKGNEFSENTATSHLFQEGRKPDTAFQRYRHSKLSGESEPTEITGKSLSECLDECLRQTSYPCKSALYSERHRICRLSRVNQYDGYRLMYDQEYDYYENFMGTGGSLRPDPVGQGSHYFNQGRPLNRPGGGYSGLFGGGSYPSYVSGGSPAPGGVPYSQELPASFYSTHSSDVSPYPVSPGVSGNAHISGSITPIPGATYSPGGYPPTFTGSIPPGGGPSLPVSSIAPYPAQFGAFGGPYPPGIDNRPFNVRCEEGEGFKHMGVHRKIKKQFVRRIMSVPNLTNCERECAESRDFLCRSFNYRAAPFGQSKENCELSDRDTRDSNINNPNFYENVPDYDFYERSAFGRNNQECLDVGQTCSEDGMEFTLRTPEGFLGRIYTHGYYDRCFYKGNGGQVNVLRISGAQGYPDCGTIRFGDMMTNIVVVQFSDSVQTSRDKRYNLTCLFRGPGEAVVTSSYMAASPGSPIPIEYLPGEHSLSSRVRLMILHEGRPTSTIAVGDPLTFRLEAQDGYNYVTDIFATNVIARDPYTGRSVTLIDRYGCPIDNSIFPALDRSREGDGLEARFNAFRIPESSYLVFEATVRTCREGCAPAYCSTGGPNSRTEQSLGRKKRDTDPIDQDYYAVVNDTTDLTAPLYMDDERIRVLKMIEVFPDRSEIPQAQIMDTVPITGIASVCLTDREYYGMIFVTFVFMTLMIVVTITAGIYYKRYWIMMSKNEMANSTSTICSSSRDLYLGTQRTRSTPSAQNLFSHLTLNSQRMLNNTSRGTECIIQNKLDELALPSVTTVEDGLRRSFEDPSEPIYTDPSLFERSRSLRSISISEDGFNIEACKDR